MGLLIGALVVVAAAGSTTITAVTVIDHVVIASRDGVALKGTYLRLVSVLTKASSPSTDFGTLELRPLAAHVPPRRAVLTETRATGDRRSVAQLSTRSVD
jgi:hypothetical protein